MQWAAIVSRRLVVSDDGLADDSGPVAGIRVG